VLLPPFYDFKSRLPLIVDVYPNSTGGRGDEQGPRISFPDPTTEYLWAAKGFAYAKLANPKEVINTDEGPNAGIDEAMDAGVNALIEAGFVDPDKVALFGLSQGGVSALYVAAHSDRFNAVIAVNSWADLFSQYFQGNGIYSEIYEEGFGNYSRYDAKKGSYFGIGKTPFEDPEIYYRNSPVFLAPQIEAAVLLIHSDMDSFDMSQFDEMFGALKCAGKDALCALLGGRT
jgi:dipeptidyl aminopeptidase/acylaminoacyl peptidase